MWGYDLNLYSRGNGSVDVKSREVDVRKRLENKGFLRWSRFWTQGNTAEK